MSEFQSPERLEKIKSLANSILQYVEECEQGTQTVDPKSRQQHRNISDVCRELQSYAAPPRHWVIGVACSYTQSMALSLIVEMGLQKHVSNTKVPTRLEDLVSRTNYSREIIKTALRQCIEYQIFEEPAPERYRHNENSRTLLDDDYAAWVHFRYFNIRILELQVSHTKSYEIYASVDEGMLAGAYLSRSIATNGYQLAEDPGKRAFGMAFGTSRSLYEYYDKEDRDRGLRFGKGMAASTETAIYGDLPVDLISSFEKLKKNATVVDVGGGRGQNSIRLAKQFRDMKFVVQDRYNDSDTAEWSRLPDGLRDRVKWQVHDFCTPQPVEGADVYLVSQVLMDHPPSVCHEILTHIVEAMAPGRSILLISDCISPTGDEGNMALTTNTLNLHMFAILGRAFWTKKEWQEMFTSVSPLLKIQKLEMLDGRAIFELIKEA
ncbi:hypothetical protein TWF730_009079 [Orbilia blumenaviensis]|uniref:O-methyltransferase domain-containing protein n=1 Tax=Orbilia blumenaviensis TaxID=1796055 RepID=A0AAV9UXH0_9PEZI